MTASVTRRGNARQPLPLDGDTERRVLHVGGQRAAREVELATKRFRGRVYWELASFQLLPGGRRPLIDRKGFSGRIFPQFLAGFAALERALRAEGEL